MRPEVQAIISALEAEIASWKRRVSDRESKLSKTAQNSSRPPGSVPLHSRQKPPPRPASGRSRGGQQGHPQQERGLVPRQRCSAIIPLHPTVCRQGMPREGRDLDCSHRHVHPVRCLPFPIA
ncbi:MAG: DUF6444 domain-containing protein [Planctomycetaceae bacterium]